ncbi:MAG: DUF11 domain-containing protein, partial [Flavobacteriales bacterium]|nr:DUF11 domain-containing protein [Flavobacteriales bacterium]
MTLAEVQAGTAIEYTIRFQNTGTYHAQRVVITDTLSTSLDWNSMEFIGSSHSCTWYMSEGVLHFVFDPIFLPDSTSDEPNSHGHVKFRMAPIGTLMVGEQIANVANIYFDFNQPIITDPAVFEVATPTFMAERHASRFELFPNPTSGHVTIVASGPMDQVEIRQMDGRLVRLVPTNASRVELDLVGLVKGPYLVTVSSPN